MNLAVAPVVRRPGEEAHGRHREQRVGPGLGALRFNREENDDEVKRARQPPRLVQPLGSQHRAGDLCRAQDLKSRATSTSAFSSAWNSRSCAGLKLNVPATMESGNCSMRTLFTLTDSL